MKRAMLRVGILLSLCAFGLIFACCSPDAALSPPVAAGAAGPVVTQAAVKVQKGVLIRSLLVSGELTAARSMEISVPPLFGRGPFPIKALAPEGTEVKPGDLLVQFDNSSLATSLEDEEINLERVENDLMRREAELDAQLKDSEIQESRALLDLERARLRAEIPRELLAARDWEENQFAYQREKKEYDRARQSLDISKKVAAQDVEVLRLNRERTAARLAQLRESLQMAAVRATRSGTVLYELMPAARDDPAALPRKVRVGDMIYLGMTVLTIPDLKEMEVRAFISEVDGGSVRPGLRARIVPDARPDRFYEGTIDYVPEVAERFGTSSIRTFNSKIKLDATDPDSMRPGMTVQVEIFLDRQEGLVLPRRAIQQQEGGAFVVTSGGEKRQIQVRLRNATHCLVEGLSEGTEVRI